MGSTPLLSKLANRTKLCRHPSCYPSRAQWRTLPSWSRFLLVNSLTQVRGYGVTSVYVDDAGACARR
jgi:hypothetical protein